MTTHTRATTATPFRPDEAHLEIHWSRWQETQCLESRAVLVDYYMERQVRPIAERLRGSLPRHVDVDDLIQQGYLGLADAMGRWDPSRGFRFETFSSRRISGAMRDWLRNQDHLPRLMRRRSRAVERAMDGFRVRAGRTPDHEELKTAIRSGMDVNEQEIELLLGDHEVPAVVNFGGLEANGDEDSGVDALAESTLEDVDAQPQQEDLREFITKGLDSTDRMIVVLYFYERLTMREIGAVVGCSESRVSQRMDSIIDRLRARGDLTPERLAVA